ncbi:hypothetical protein FSST1_002650 [Fusarium sambucinum]
MPNAEYIRIYSECWKRELDQGTCPVIVIHPSLARGANDYDIVAQFLVEAGYRVVRPQPRGIGKSTGPMDKLTIHDFAADVAMVLDHIKCGPAVIVGHAWGSMPARMLAADRPDLVRGVIMAAASAGKLPPGSTEKPFSRLRKEIDGSGDMTIPESKRLEYFYSRCSGAEYDAVVVKDVMKQYLGDRVEVQIIKNAGHALAPEQPEAMANAVIDFNKKL